MCNANMSKYREKMSKSQNNECDICLSEQWTTIANQRDIYVINKLNEYESHVCSKKKKTLANQKMNYYIPKKEQDNRSHVNNLIDDEQ